MDSVGADSPRPLKAFAALSLRSMADLVLENARRIVLG
jgi:hypothetical protein